MTPATATGALGVGDHQHLRRQLRVLPSRVFSVSPGSRRCRGSRAADSRVVEGVHRLTELEQHVVGDVDDVADRTARRRAQPRLHPVRRRADRHIGDRAGIARDTGPGSR